MTDSADLRSWSELEALLSRHVQKGPTDLSFDEVNRMAALYRHAAADLAEARSAGWDRRRARYLEGLVQRAHPVIYPPPAGGWRVISRLLFQDVAVAYRDTLPLQLIAIGLFVVGAIAGYVATVEDVELAYAMIGAMYPAELVQGLIEDPLVQADLLSAGQHTDVTSRGLFAFTLVANNTRVALMAFALGIAAGIPTVLIHTFNGAVLGSISALFVVGDYGTQWWVWALPHAVPEILALCIATAGGLSLARALIDAGPRSRRDALAEAGRRAAVLLGLVLVLIGYAAIIEAFFRQSSASTTLRLGVAAMNAVALTAYLTFAGRTTRAP